MLFLDRAISVQSVRLTLLNCSNLNGLLECRSISNLLLSELLCLVRRLRPRVIPSLILNCSFLDLFRLEVG